MTLSPTNPERPIQTENEDKLERSLFIERLTAAVVSPATCRATGVVVGITGAWGSGKSSVLNLLSEHIKEKHPNAFVVRFDPWLVAGRNDLIAEFFGELIGTINTTEKDQKKIKKLVKQFTEYGAQLAPISELWSSGSGMMVSATLNILRMLFSKKKSLYDLRTKLEKELKQISAPIIVLIDEIDRVEDAEIRTVAQLVRSVVDFPGISYVLAYDAKRVIQALGADAPTNDIGERGRSYLEKIVQLQIPLPIIFGDEVSRFLTADLNQLKMELQLPDNFESIMRYQELVRILCEYVIDTLRDIQRLVQTFHVLRSMLFGEVDWIDLLAYSALATKSPRTIERMLRDPEDYLDNPISAKGVERLQRLQKTPVEERVNDLIAPSERNDGTKKLLRFVFPSLWEGSRREPGYADALRERRPLLTTLRLGLLPGAFSREAMLELVNSPTDQVEARLRGIYESGTLGQFIDRLDDIYFDLSMIDHIAFWRGVGGFIKKPNCEWMASYNPMHEVVRNLAEVLERAVRKNKTMREKAASVFKKLCDDEESELTAHWLRTHMRCHGLFGLRKREDREWFLDAGETEKIVRRMVSIWRKEHLNERLIPCRWDLQPVYTIIDTNQWGEECQMWLKNPLSKDRALDGFTLMLFGAHFSTDSSTIEKMCGYEWYIERVKSRMASNTIRNIHETVRLALEKAITGGL